MIKEGDKVKVITEGTVVKVSNSHGLAVLLQLDQRDFTEPRLIWIDEDEIDKTTSLMKWVKEGEKHA